MMLCLMVLSTVAVPLSCLVLLLFYYGTSLTSDCCPSMAGWMADWLKLSKCFMFMSE